jgi:hypothetical protein
LGIVRLFRLTDLLRDCPATIDRGKDLLIHGVQLTSQIRERLGRDRIQLPK